MLRKLASGLAVAAILPFTQGLAPVNGPRQFHLTLSWGQHSPNGVTRDVILINGQFPGPTLEINEGEEVWVTVKNEISEDTTMHFHGIEMDGTPWSDGVPGVTQREIHPGDSFVHKWKATNHGEHWYHSHHSGQIDDGQLGAIIIHPKTSAPTPFGLIANDLITLSAIKSAVSKVKPLVLGDWRDITSKETWDIQVASGLELPCMDSLLVNGKGRTNCLSAEKLESLLTPEQIQLLAIGNFTALTDKGCLPKEVIAIILSAGKPTNISAIPDSIFDTCMPTQGSNAVITIDGEDSAHGEAWVALNIIGSYSTVSTIFSIDELPMWVYAVDGEFIEPQKVHAIAISNGERYSFLVKVKFYGDYTIRHASTAPVQILAGEATLSYSPASHGASINAAKKRDSTPYINEIGAPLSEDVIFFNHAAQKAYPPSPISQTVDQTVVLEMGNTDRAYKWSMNGTSLSMNLENEEPILFFPQPNIMNNVTITTLNDTWVDLIFVALTFPQPSHPIHKHGNKMWLLGSGDGLFTWNTVAEAALEIPENFNFVDPPKRDGISTRSASLGPSWTAVRYHVTNPGAWMLHCHIQTHFLGGMGMVIQDGVDAWGTVPPEYYYYGTS